MLTKLAPWRSQYIQVSSHSSTPRSPSRFTGTTGGFEVKLDVGYGEMRWITVSSPQQPDTAIVQEPIAQGYGIRDAAVRDPAGNMLRIQELTQGEAQ